LRIVTMTAAVTAAGSAALPVAAQEASGEPAQSPAAMTESPGAAGASAAPTSATQVDLPPGWQPEGIARLGTDVFVGSLADGAIYRIDAATHEGDIIVPGQEGAMAVGIEADEPNGRIWVAGGGTGEVRVYAADRGDLLETYSFEGTGFINDVAFTGDAAVATDSNVAQLLVIPLGADGSLPPPEDATATPISGDLVYQEDAFNANGIVAAADGTPIVVQSVTGGLFRVDPTTGATTAIDTGGADLTAGDGMYIDGSTLYVSRNQAEIIATLELDEALSTASLVSELTSDGLDIPTTLTLVGDDLWIVNARFGTEATPETEYSVSIWPGGQPPAA
jgi:sugar lactone lactonase YvrE